MKGPILPGFRHRPVMTDLHSRSALLRQQSLDRAHGLCRPSVPRTPHSEAEDENSIRVTLRAPRQ